MKFKLKILHLEDSADDCELVFRMLKDDGIDADIVRCDDREKFIAALDQQDFDLIFADCTLPQFDGLRALELARRAAPGVPFIFVSGTIAEESAIDSLRSGATDYVLKHHLSRLVPAVRRALAEREERIKNREMEQRLRQAQRLEAVGTLAGGIAHDFNNILTIIRSYTSLLPQESEQPERVREIASIIDRASGRGAELVSELMAFARKTEGSLLPIDLNQRVQEIAAMLEPTLPASITMDLRLGDDLPEIHADAGQLERIIINLVTNARDAMPDGGTISFATSRIRYEETPPSPVSDMTANHYLRLRVSDTGSGMDEATRLRMFEPFFTTKPLGKGTGLGMPVVYGLVQSHHGLIDVQSKLGEGTAVSVYFPVPTEPAAQVEEAPMDAAPAVEGTETILLVDDEADLRYFVEMMLELHGYKVISVGDGESALAALDSPDNDVRVLFSDLGLPMIDGLELSRRVRAVHPEVKIILCSGYTDAKLQAKMTEEGIDGFIPKPYDAATLLGMVRSTLDRAGVHQKPSP